MTQKRNSDVFLRPRFSMEIEENQQVIINKFTENSKDLKCKYCTKIVDGHIVIDVPVEENKFWSPQLNIEIVKISEKKSTVKGLFGPKPKVWTLFMFFHFLMAVAFIGFGIMAYVQFTLKHNNSFSLGMVVFIPILWVVMYFIGRWGKRTGRNQMRELNQFLMKTLNK